MENTPKTTVVPVSVAGNTTVHAGRKVGTYPSGNPMYAKLCSSDGRANHRPSALAEGTEITCKRCQAKLAHRAEQRAQAVVAQILAGDYATFTADQLAHVVKTAGGDRADAALAELVRRSGRDPIG